MDKINAFLNGSIADLLIIESESDRDVLFLQAISKIHREMTIYFYYIPLAFCKVSCMLETG